MKKEATNKNEQCVSCGEDTAIRNPTGKCDHLYYPENINKNEQADMKEILEYVDGALEILGGVDAEKRVNAINKLKILLKKQEARIRKEYKNCKCIK